MFEIVLIVFITISLTEIVKRAKFIGRKRAPLFAIGCGIFLVAGYGVNNIHLYIGTNAVLNTVVLGMAIGFLSCGVHSFVSALLNVQKRKKFPHA